MKTLLDALHTTDSPSVPQLVRLLAARNDDGNMLRDAAIACMTRHVGDTVFLRGLVEVSNRCVQNCHYCGIRADAPVSRYRVTEDELMQAAHQCNRLGYGSMVLQSGEMPSDGYVDFICRAVEKIKKSTASDILPSGLGITLSLGVLSQPQYQRLFDAGAHRYLLRIETSDARLFASLHPKAQSLSARLEALERLQSVGFQTGTGVMTGLPGQTLEMLANDILTFRKLNIDMVGMGPFLPSDNTPMANARVLPAMERFQLGLNMIAVTRLVCRDINIASTTALEALHPQGRLLGLQWGANVAMPSFTPEKKRIFYTLYNDKPMSATVDGVVAAIETIGRKVGLNAYGDPRHFFSRLNGTGGEKWGTE
ncbi:MAG: [FeFe] hydrogenase H-cluster radical SAM maturase HydE [Deltaproteobacteria bacterium]|nr:[FeFe] hydrogenase H-cluster radical SAM maturase HydE [Deltaproteobacteria bacterium]